MTIPEQIGAIHKGVTDIKVMIGKMEVHQSNHAKDIAEMKQEVDKIKALKNKGHGVLIACSIAISIVVPLIIKLIFK